MTDLEREAARAGLLNLIGDQLNRRRPVPCVTGPAIERAKWTSDDPADQTAAAARCLDCAVFAQCRQYAEAHPEPAGVWGGLTEADRRPKVGRPARPEGGDDDD